MGVRVHIGVENSSGMVAVTKSKTTMARLSGETRWEPLCNEAASLPPIHGSGEAAGLIASGP